MGMLVALFVVTSDMMALPGMPRALARTIATTSLLTAVAAVVGVALSAFGRITPLVGTCGDLLPGPLSRAQAGFPLPNMLASYCIFAFGVIERDDAGLSQGWRRVLRGALALTVILTTSRGILGFALAAAIRHAATPARRRFAGGVAAVLVAAMVALTVVNLTFQPLRPWELQLREGPSGRLQSAATSLETLAAHSVFGSGPGTSPGRRDGIPFDAHLTPLNIAATLGLPALAGLAFAVFCLWRARSRPTDLATWGMLAGLGLDGLGQDVEDFRHVWIALGLADAGRRQGGADA
jgi:O-Antigen ligase